jgi:hypothetical protein
VVRVVEDCGEGLEDVRDLRPDLEFHGDVGGGAGGEADGVVGQDFVRADLDE